MANLNKNDFLEKLTLRLKTSGPMTAVQLQKFAEISQPQLSRYLKLLEDKILKIGRGKNTYYVHTREIAQVGYKIPVFKVDEKGNLEESGILFPISPKGFYWESKDQKQSRIFEDLPYFLNDIRPSGFLGRLIPRAYPDWGFPDDIRLWTADSTLRYLTHFGVDLIGNQIIGESSAQKFLLSAMQKKTKNKKFNEIALYEELAKNVETQGIAGSSAGGEHPKFLTQRLSDGAHVLVKFVANSNNKITQRRIDLIRAEDIAAKLLHTINFSESTRIVEGSAYTFLEVTRFDRIGTLGRKGLISLFSLDAEFIGSGQGWSIVAQQLSDLKLLDASLLSKIQFLEYFGQLIGNTDMHSGNLSFYFENEKILGLAPVYDMLPMKYAPIQERISSESIIPIAPKPSSILLWKKALELAIRYWQLIQQQKEFSATFIDIAKRNEVALSKNYIP